MLNFLLAALVIYGIAWKFKQQQGFKRSLRTLKRVHVPFIGQENTRLSRSPIAHRKHKHLATRNEQKLYFALQSILPETYVIHCQVSMMALVSPIDLKPSFNTLIKRVDYVITDRATRIVAVIELDDSSQQTKKRIDRDNYVNEVLNAHHNFLRINARDYYDPSSLAKILEQGAGIKCL